MTTNRDKINKMTNEELANILKTPYKCCIYRCSFCDRKYKCKDGITQWLNRECEDNNNAR